MARRAYYRIAASVGGHETRLKLLRKRGVRIGKQCRVYTEHFGVEPWLIRIGDHCTVTSGVRFVTHDGACWVLRPEHPGLEDFGAIDLRDNCFIGVNAVILPGVKIGPNSIVAAGAVVARDVPPDTVVGGVPARPIMTLDQFRERKLKNPHAFDTPTDPGERREYLEQRFQKMLDDER